MNIVGRLLGQEGLQGWRIEHLLACRLHVDGQDELVDFRVGLVEGLLSVSLFLFLLLFSPVATEHISEFGDVWRVRAAGNKRCQIRHRSCGRVDRRNNWYGSRH